MINYEVLQLATMTLIMERDENGMPREWQDVTTLMPVFTYTNVGHFDPDYRYSIVNAADKPYNRHHWYMSTDPHAWLLEQKYPFSLHWRETTRMPAWHCPRHYVLEMVFEEPKHALMFKLAWGGA